MEILAGLPAATLERLAASLTEVQFPAGATVITQGRRTATASTSSTTARWRSRGTCSAPGASFGEIALLRDIPRTATVTASTDVVLQALERDEFLAAVTGHEPSSPAADARHRAPARRACARPDSRPRRRHRMRRCLQPSLDLIRGSPALRGRLGWLPRAALGRVLRAHVPRRRGDRRGGRERQDVRRDRVGRRERQRPRTRGRPSRRRTGVRRDGADRQVRAQRDRPGRDRRALLPAAGVELPADRRGASRRWRGRSSRRSLRRSATSRPAARRRRRRAA